jgi:hypothetical protein
MTASALWHLFVIENPAIALATLVAIVILLAGALERVRL